MSELVPRPANLPAARTGSPSFTRLAARTAALTASALALKEGLWSLQRRMERDASAEVARTADQVQTNAQGLHDAHQGEYRGVYEAVNASGVVQARPGFYRTR